MFPELAPRMFVGPAPRARHLLAILTDAVDDCLALLLRCLFFDIAKLCFTGRTSSRRQRARLESERQLSPDQLDDIALPDLAARLRPLSIDFDVSAGDGRRRQTPGLVKTCEPQPAINAQ